MEILPALLCIPLLLSSCTAPPPAKRQLPMEHVMESMERPRRFESLAAAEKFADRVVKGLPHEPIATALRELNLLHWHIHPGPYSLPRKDIADRTPTHLYVAEFSGEGVPFRIFLYVTEDLERSTAGKLRATTKRSRIVQVVVMEYNSRFGQRREWP